MAFTSLAALAGGTAATTALVLGAVAEVGIAMSVVGAVTGNKDLLKIGSVMGLVGGVGGMLAGSGAATGATALGEAGTEAALASASGEAASAFGGSAAVDATTESLLAGLESAAPQAVTQTSGLQATSISQPSGPIIQSNVAPEVGAQMQASVPDAGGLQGPAGVQTPADVGIQAPADVATPFTETNPTDMRLAAGTQTGPIGTVAPQSADSFWSSFSTFAKNNQKLLSGGMQVVGGALNGMNQRSMFDERMNLERQRTAQTGYGNTTSNFAPRSIIAGARA